MLFMNDSDIEQACARYRHHAVLGPASRFLSQLADETNQHSDGWCYWPLPCRAARKLQELIQAGGNPTQEQLQRALVPIKSFYTRRGNKAGMQWPTLV